MNTLQVIMQEQGDAERLKSDRLPILRRRNVLPTDIARYDKSLWSTKEHPTQVILSNFHWTRTGDVNWQREFNVYNSSNKIVTGCLIDTEHISTTTTPQTPLIRNSRSTTDPKTQKCAADRHCKIQQIPMVYEGTPNSSYLIQPQIRGTGDVNWQREFNIQNTSSKS